MHLILRILAPLAVAACLATGCDNTSVADDNVAEMAIQEELRDLSKIVDDEGRRIRLSLQDLTDEIQAFVRARGILSVEGPPASPRWRALEELTQRRLEVRIEIAIIEATGEPEHRQDELNALHAELSAMDAEDVSMRGAMSEQLAQTLRLQEMLSHREALIAQRHENSQFQTDVRMAMMSSLYRSGVLKSLRGD